MRALTDSLKTIMSAVSGALDVLPASGGATEDMTFTDEGERDDSKLAGENLMVTAMLETPKPTWIYREVQSIHRAQDHMFRHFLDGSYRHYFLATGLEHDRSTPIFLSQIAMAILERSADGRLQVVKDFKRHQWFLLIAKSEISDQSWKDIKRATDETKLNIKIQDLAESDPISGDFKDLTMLREKGRGKTRYLMSAMELDLINEFCKAGPSGWVIKDGLISFGRGGKGLKSPKVIGVSKSFTTNQHFNVGGGRKKESVASLISSLPAHHRTPAFEGYEGNTAFWYLRLRKSQQVLYPLFGVIKVEIPVLEGQTLTTELLDRISGALLAEQWVTPYGADDRWHAHLYPIYQAECASKQLFCSTEVIQGCINYSLRTK